MQDVKGQPSGMAKASLILGICSIIPFIGGGAGLAAIILGIIDLVKISKGEASEAGKKFDIAGIVLGVVLPIVWAVLFSVIWAVLWGTAAMY